MSDDNSSPQISTPEACLSPEQIRARLNRLDRSGHIGKMKRGRIKLIFDVLDAIAKGRVTDPARIARATIEGIDSDSMFPVRSPFKEKNDGPEARQHITSNTDPRLNLIQDLANATTAADLFENAEKISDAMQIHQSVLDCLYRNSRFNSVSREAWEKEIRIAFAVEFIMRKFFTEPTSNRFESLIEGNIDIHAFEKLKSLRGTLLLTFHGAFVLVARKLFSETLEIGRTIGRNARDDPRGALFGALRTLQAGGALLMAPDGPRGNQSANLNVLGTSSPGGDGAAYLAYTLSCNTAWYTVVREDNRFVPVVEPGPTRGGSESFAEFKDRLYRFYASKIEATITDDPRNIALRPRWTRTLRNSGLQVTCS